MKIHPVADLFPMLADDELRELADDIKARGLLQPIILDESGAVLDGRNRLAACKLAGVEPTFETYQGDDPDGYALAVNVARRHMTQGQKAIVIARSYKLYKSANQEKTGKAHGVPQPRLSAALLIEEVSPELAAQVLSGVKPFDAAHKEAQEMRRERRAAEKKRARLREEAEDLLALVDEERMNLDEATAAMEARQSEEKRKAEEERAEVRRQAQVQTHQIQDIIVTLSQMRGFSPGEKYDPSLAIPGRPVNREVLDQADQALGELIEIWEKRGLE